MRYGPYIDPGETTDRLPSWGERWGEADSPAGDWASRGTAAWADRANRWSQGLHAPVGSEEWRDAYAPLMGMTGITKVLRSPTGVNLIQAYANHDPSVRVGSLGYRQLPGRPAIFQDIKVDPAYRGQGYGRELLDAFRRESGDNMRFGGTITNSVPFWERLAETWKDIPQFSQGILDALRWR